MAPTARLPPKRDVALALLEQASMYVHLDPRADAVQVPPWFKKQPQLVLQVGLNMAVPIPDLHVDDDGLSCTLSFNRSPFFCMIPWSAVFALVGEGGQAMVWAEDVPAEVAAQAQAQKAPEKPTHLRSVPAAEKEKSTPVEPAALPSPSSPKKGAALAVGKASKTGKGGKLLAATALKDSPKRAAKTKPLPSSRAATPRGAGKPVAKLPVEPRARAKKPSPTFASSPKASAEHRPAAVPAPAKKASEAKPDAVRSGADSSKPKRELPPYLRVVK